MSVERSLAQLALSFTSPQSTARIVCKDEREAQAVMDKARKLFHNCYRCGTLSLCITGASYFCLHCGLTGIWREVQDAVDHDGE
jgi:hypothetical protein